MTAIFSKRLAALLSLVILIPLCGCLGRSQPTRFYLLQSISGIPAEKTAAQKREVMHIGVGPITIPEYIDRPQIVTLVGPHELDLADFDQWAEPLKESVPRILGENLSALLTTQHIYVYPWPGSTPLDYQIEVDITRFDAARSADAMLNARWTILAGNGKDILMRMNSVITQKSGGQGYEALVAAESQLIDRLSREIAAAITTIARGK
jgi:uncharacterized protein